MLYSNWEKHFPWGCGLTIWKLPYLYIGDEQLWKCIVGGFVLKYEVTDKQEGFIWWYIIRVGRISMNLYLPWASQVR